jgi:hypothetical protein
MIGTTRRTCTDALNLYAGFTALDWTRGITFRRIYQPTPFERPQVKICLCTRCLLVSFSQRAEHRIDDTPQHEEEC